MTITTIDMHTGGEPLRIITGGLPGIKGGTILEKRKYFREHFDHIRTGLMWEPRGHADMYGVVITDPVSEGSDFGAIFMHNEGYSTMCGHAVIALVKYAVEKGLINKPEPSPGMLIDVPAGLIRARATLENDKVTRSSFLNVPSFVSLRDGHVDVEGLGQVRFDIAFGGAFYAFVQAEDVRLDLVPANSRRLIEAGRLIKKAVADQYEIRHPFEEDLGFLYGTIFTGHPGDPANHSRNVCIFADGELDRSATGSGVSARAALHHANGELGANEKITIESILGTTLDVEIKSTTTFGPYPAVIPEVTGQAWFTGEHTFIFEQDDPLKKGFIIR